MNTRRGEPSQAPLLRGRRLPQFAPETPRAQRVPAPTSALRTLKARALPVKLGLMAERHALPDASVVVEPTEGTPHSAAAARPVLPPAHLSAVEELVRAAPPLLTREVAVSVVQDMPQRSPQAAAHPAPPGTVQVPLSGEERAVASPVAPQAETPAFTPVRWLRMRRQPEADLAARAAAPEGVGLPAQLPDFDVAGLVSLTDAALRVRERKRGALEQKIEGARALAPQRWGISSPSEARPAGTPPSRLPLARAVAAPVADRLPAVEGTPTRRSPLAVERPSAAAPTAPATASSVPARVQRSAAVETEPTPASMPGQESAADADTASGGARAARGEALPSNLDDLTDALYRRLVRRLNLERERRGF